jgi:hypothetical protein
MGLTLADIDTHAGILAAMTDTTDPPLTTAERYAIINELYLRWHEKIEQRFKNLYGEFSIITGGFFVDGTSTNIAEIDRAYAISSDSYSASDAGMGNEVEVIDVSEMFELYKNAPDSQFISAVLPTRIAFKRLQTDTEADIGKWRCYVYPKTIADATTLKISVSARVIPALLAGGTDQPDISDEARYTIARLAAARYAAVVGEDQEFIAEILRGVDEDVLASMGMSDLMKRPRSHPAERAT